MIGSTLATTRHVITGSVKTEVMAIQYAFQQGKKILNGEEYQQRLGAGETADLDSPYEAAKRSAPDFSPIGIGKPLLLELLTVYSGDLKTGFFGSRNDVLVTSAVKADIGSSKVKPMAINLLKQDVSAKEQFSPGARTEGSPVIYYNPGLTDPTVFFDLQAITDSFDDKLIKQISSLMTSAGKLPIFAPASLYLLVGGALSKIFSKLGSSLLETAPFLRVDTAFRFDTAGVNPPQPENLIIHNSSDAAEFHSAATAIQQDEGGVYLTVNGNRYAGPAPYAIINVDGKSRDDLKDFAPTQATTALLNQFYGADSDPSQVIGTVKSALSLYNDSSYSMRATELVEELKTLKKGSANYEKALQLLKGYAANIKDPNFKVTVPEGRETEGAIGDKERSKPKPEGDSNG